MFELRRGVLENETGFAKIVLGKQHMMMTMQCTNSTRFSSSGFAGCHNSTPLTRDLALEIRLMVPEGRSAICVLSLRVDLRDTTIEVHPPSRNRRHHQQRFVVLDRRENAPGKQRTKLKVKPPLTSMDR